MRADIKNNDDFIEINGCKLTPEMLERLKAYQEDEWLSQVQGNIAEVLLSVLMLERGAVDQPKPSKERLDDISGRLTIFISELDDLKLPLRLHNK